MSSKEDAFVNAMNTADVYVCAYERLHTRLKEVCSISCDFA